ncbi:MAG: alpha/beta fold hydrolase [Anaerolineae bacterium]|nr:alpha/beta fold hydrolase [Anaerolineae bacterium]
MKKDVLFIHGAGQGAYEEDGKLVASLQQALGTGYAIRYPKVEEENPELEVWQAQIEEELAAFDNGSILVGHSFGGSILLKYLSEHTLEKPVGGIYIIAAPYWGAEDWQYEAYALLENVASKLPQESPIVLYHSRDDEIVPFSHLALYAEKLPQATVRAFEDRGHQLNNNLAEVAEDIKKGE